MDFRFAQKATNASVLAAPSEVTLSRTLDSVHNVKLKLE